MAPRRKPALMCTECFRSKRSLIATGSWAHKRIFWRHPLDGGPSSVRNPHLRGVNRMPPKISVPNHFKSDRVLKRVVRVRGGEGGTLFPRSDPCTFHILAKSSDCVQFGIDAHYQMTIPGKFCQTSILEQNFQCLYLTELNRYIFASYRVD